MAIDLPHLIGWSALAVTVSAVIFRAAYRLGRDAESRYHEKLEKHRESAFYYKGLNYLLSDEQDKAIEEFIKVVRINSETVEIHLSLGNLFRSRGEVGRAIRIHQNIIARPTLSAVHRTSALYALAEDYRQGGFVDRAVEACRLVLSVDPNHAKTLSSLLMLHESEGKWDLALQVLQRYKRVTGSPDPRREAHLLLRIGQEQMSGGAPEDEESAIDRFRSAVRIFPGCVEGYRLLGEAQLHQGRIGAAISSFSTPQKTRPSHFFLMVDSLLKAYTDQEDLRGFEKLMVKAVNTPSASTRLIILWSRHLEEKGRIDEAIEILKNGVQQHPGAVGLARQLILMLSRRNRWQDAVGVAERCLDHQLSRQPIFQCSQCGFKAQDIYWQCPQCHHWDTMEPL
ncbi:MAG: tetratricopeptide repeat protein [Magnetococcales bacterium]|nr:tetratricopeptide repeat protein [Magnetococcales bacterium]